MFGYVRTNLQAITDEERERYRACYCGLCRALGKRHGLAGKLALTYDMTFLNLFLTSLYEPEEDKGMLRCIVHPAKPHPYAASEITDYCADMTVALTYHQCMDDWADDRKLSRRAYAQLLAGGYRRVKERWPQQVELIERSLKELAAVEQKRETSIEAAAACFGQLMGGLFLMKKDYWSGALRSFGDSLGRFVYLVDAACDYDKDVKSGSYNPVALMGWQPEDMREPLKQVLGASSAVFEALPLLQDAQLMRSILYSGLWQGYNEAMEKRKENATHGG